MLEEGCDGVEWIHPAEDSDQRQFVFKERI